MRKTPVASSLISAAELLSHLGGSEPRIVDARFDLSQPQAGKRMYLEGHVPGAVHLDLDDDLSGEAGRGNGRHPLPDMTEFAAKLGSLGIDNDSDIVVYDQSGSMYAARAWWLLRYAGQRRVRFLDGGLDAYLAAGGRLTDQVTPPPATTFELDVNEHLVMTAEELTTRLGEPGFTLVDARSAERYRGDVEPLDDLAGHIPSAINLPFALGSENGVLLSAERLADVYPVAELELAAEMVAYCGSGVSAAHLILSLEEAGITGIKLYPGSWSEWSSRPGMPVATGPGPGEVDA